MLILFGWYFATDFGLRKRILATVLMLLLVVFSLVTMYPPRRKAKTARSSSVSISRAARRS